MHQAPRLQLLLDVIDDRAPHVHLGDLNPNSVRRSSGGKLEERPLVALEVAAEGEAAAATGSRPRAWRTSIQMST